MTVTNLFFQILFKLLFIIKLSYFLLNNRILIRQNFIFIKMMTYEIPERLCITMSQ